jgi:hypothetical protein
MCFIGETIPPIFIIYIIPLCLFCQICAFGAPAQSAAPKKSSSGFLQDALILSDGRSKKELQNGSFWLPKGPVKKYSFVVF